MDWAAFDTPLYPEPEFLVEPPDGQKEWAEIDRQATLLQLMRHAAPSVMVYANANAGRRARHVASKEGIKSGVHDLTFVFHDLVAWVEMKGYDKRGRPGKLTDNQISFGNRLTEFGQPCACFFSPHKAADWLREQGFPIAEIRR